jgi:hypothetical protein
MSKWVFAKIVVAAVIVVFVCGCATGGKGPTNEELVKSQLESLKAAVLAKDIGKIMNAVSENFYQASIGDKAAIKDLVQQGIDGGYLEGVQIDLSKAVIKVEKDTATVSPITASASIGSVTVQVTLKKEQKGLWLITGGDEA